MSGINIFSQNGINFGIATASVTAAAGGGQANATICPTTFTLITTNVTNLDSVKLPAGAVLGLVYVIGNRTANSANVFPPSGERLGNQGTDAASSLAAGVQQAYWKIDGTRWLVFSLGTAS